MDRKDIEWLFTHEPAEEQDIISIESALSIKFPSDYIECAKKHNGGNPSFQVYDFEGKQEAVFNGLLGLCSKESNFILDVYEDVQDRLVKGVYPFADDPFGNLICFDYRNNTGIPTVVFWDHEISQENREKAIIPICDTFTELLFKLRAE